MHFDRNWFCMSTCYAHKFLTVMNAVAAAVCFIIVYRFGCVITSVLVCLADSVAVRAANVLNFEHWAMIRAFRCVAHLSPLWIQMETMRLMNMDAAMMPAIQVSDDAVAQTVMVYFPLLSVV